VVDLEERALARRERLDKLGAWMLPLIMIALGIFAWDRSSRSTRSRITSSPVRDASGTPLSATGHLLIDAAFHHLMITGAALAGRRGRRRGARDPVQAVAADGDVALPYAVILQVTPIVAIAPLIFIYVEDRLVGLSSAPGLWPSSRCSPTPRSASTPPTTICATCSRFTAPRVGSGCLHLELPSALPYFLGGLRIAGGLALIGAVVAEYVAGTGGIGSGLAFTILEAGYRLNIPRMFAALILIAATGVLIYAVLSFVSWLLLHKWHESALKRER
jgi:NitT/TauT family transport system permease protein